MNKRIVSVVKIVDDDLVSTAEPDTGIPVTCGGCDRNSELLRCLRRSIPVGCPRGCLLGPTMVHGHEVSHIWISMTQRSRVPLARYLRRPDLPSVLMLVEQRSPREWSVMTVGS